MKCSLKKENAMTLSSQMNINLREIQDNGVGVRYDQCQYLKVKSN